MQHGPPPASILPPKDRTQPLHTGTKLDPVRTMEKPPPHLSRTGRPYRTDRTARNFWRSSADTPCKSACTPIGPSPRSNAGENAASRDDRRGRMPGRRFGWPARNIRDAEAAATAALEDDAQSQDAESCIPTREATIPSSWNDRRDRSGSNDRRRPPPTATNRRSSIVERNSRRSRNPPIVPCGAYDAPARLVRRAHDSPSRLTTWGRTADRVEIRGHRRRRRQDRRWWARKADGWSRRCSTTPPPRRGWRGARSSRTRTRRWSGGTIVANRHRRRVRRRVRGWWGSRTTAGKNCLRSTRSRRW
mmetsp:Transcript_2408/g.5954  ORF Transcript_2408/g.5954 Transcript_2408/m.5954 type:complete len:304 (+) Transcript_2408:817-1728(+)